MRVQRILVILLRAGSQYKVQGVNFFQQRKKNPLEEEGLIKCVAGESWICFSSAYLFEAGEIIQSAGEQGSSWKLVYCTVISTVSRERDCAVFAENNKEATEMHHRGFQQRQQAAHPHPLSVQQQGGLELIVRMGNRGNGGSLAHQDHPGPWWLIPAGEQLGTVSTQYRICLWNK